MRRLAVAAVTLGALALIGAPATSAGPFAADDTVQVSGNSLIPEPCIGDANAPTESVNVYNSEVEPWVSVDPSDPLHLVGAWQQDRWNDGGGRGLVTATSFDGGLNWELNADTMWEDPITLKRDENPNVLNDKNSMTADPLDSSLAYAVWDRIASPPGEPPAPAAGEHAIGYRGPTWFSRTTDGGDSWEPARMIFDPGTVNQTIGNQIVVTGSGELVNAFDLIFNFKNAHKARGFNLAVIRSEDKGETWDEKATIVDKHFTFQGLVIDPDDPNTDTQRVRTGDILPEVAADPNGEAVYLVGQDFRFGPRQQRLLVPVDRRREDLV